jgi:hypothetical protein
MSLTTSGKLSIYYGACPSCGHPKHGGSATCAHPFHNAATPSVAATSAHGCALQLNPVRVPKRWEPPAPARIYTH